MIQEDKKITWIGSHQRPVLLYMRYYAEIKEMQFDIGYVNGIAVGYINSTDRTISNINVETAKQIRDRLNEFINEVERNEKVDLTDECDSSLL